METLILERKWGDFWGGLETFLQTNHVNQVHWISRVQRVESFTTSSSSAMGHSLVGRIFFLLFFLNQMSRINRAASALYQSTKRAQKDSANSMPQKNKFSKRQAHGQVGWMHYAVSFCLVALPSTTAWVTDCFFLQSDCLVFWLSSQHSI